jgi:hypothetical protein
LGGFLMMRLIYRVGGVIEFADGKLGYFYRLRFVVPIGGMDSNAKQLQRFEHHWLAC